MELLNGFVPDSHERHVWSFARTSLDFKVRGTKKSIFCPFGSLRAVYVW